MRFDRPLCPVCSRPAQAVLYLLSTRIGLKLEPDGSFGRNGQTIRWASERPVSIEGRQVLSCSCGEEWLSARLDEQEVSEAACGGLPPFSPDEPSGGEACVLRLSLETDPPLSGSEDLRARVREKLDAALAARRRRPPVSPAPRYDQVLFQRSRWLDSL